MLKQEAVSHELFCFQMVSGEFFSLSDIKTQRLLIYIIKHLSIYFHYLLSFISLQCSQSCGMGFQIRKVQCYGDREIDYTEKVCKKLQRPTAVRLCKITSCGEGKKNIDLYHERMVKSTM